VQKRRSSPLGLQGLDDAIVDVFEGHTVEGEAAGAFEDGLPFFCPPFLFDINNDGAVRTLRIRRCVTFYLSHGCDQALQIDGLEVHDAIELPGVHDPRLRHKRPMAAR